MSCYWALGGTLGDAIQGATIKELARARGPWFVAVLWLTAMVKVLGGIGALALDRGWAGRLPRPLVLLGGWGAGLGMVAYGGVPLVVNGLMLSGVLRVDDAIDWTAIRWHFLLWDPWWLLGGVRYAAAIRHYQRQGRGDGTLA